MQLWCCVNLGTQVAPPRRALLLHSAQGGRFAACDWRRWRSPPPQDLQRMHWNIRCPSRYVPAQSQAQRHQLMPPRPKLTARRHKQRQALLCPVYPAKER